MGFLNPWFLAGIAAIVGPVVVHLYRRHESSRTPFSSLMFVTPQPTRSRRRLRLENLALFSARTIAILLLALAFARPYFKTDSQTLAAGAGPRSVVILIDNSYSMRAANRFAAAKEQALQIIEGLDDKDVGFIVSFSNTSDLLNAPPTPKATLRSLVEQLTPTFRPTDFNQALRRAAQLLSSTPNQRQEIHLISDLQETGWGQKGASQPEIPEEVTIFPHVVSPGDGRNAFVAQLDVNETGNRAELVGSVRTVVFASEKTTASIALHVNNKLLTRRELTLEGGKPGYVEFEPFRVEPGLSKGFVELQVADDLVEDNRVYFVLNPANRARVLVLVEGEASSAGPLPDDTLYLRTALGGEETTSFQLEYDRIASAGAKALAEYNAIVLHNPGAVAAPLAESLRRSVEAGAGLIVSLGDRVETRSLNQDLGALLPGRLEAVRTAGPKGDFLIGELQEQHSVFRVFQPVHHSYFLATPFRAYVDCSPIEGSMVLMKLDDGRPLLLERACGKGRVLLFTSSLDRNWTDLPLRSVFLPFCQELVKYALHFEQINAPPIVGEAITLHRLNRNFGKVLETTSGAFGHNWKITTPSGSSLEVDRGSPLQGAPLVIPEEPGFYEAEVRNLRNVTAVNLAPSESDLRGTDPARLESSIRRTVLMASASNSFHEFSATSHLAGKAEQGIWWRLALAALGVILVEGCLANLYGGGKS